jgi:hypothetical protein
VKHLEAAEALHREHCKDMEPCMPGFGGHCDCACCLPLPEYGIDQQFARANSCCCYCGALWPGYTETIRDKAART